MKTETPEAETTVEEDLETIFEPAPGHGSDDKDVTLLREFSLSPDPRTTAKHNRAATQCLTVLDIQTDFTGLPILQVARDSLDRRSRGIDAWGANQMERVAIARRTHAMPMRHRLRRFFTGTNPNEPPTQDS